MQNATFIDLRSERGTVVLEMACSYPKISKAIEIELVEERHNEAHMRPGKETDEIRRAFQLECADLHEANISDATVIYVYDLCFGVVLSGDQGGQLWAPCHREKGPFDTC